LSPGGLLAPESPAYSERWSSRRLSGARLGSRV
jgi:hypothetical protein